MSTKYHNNIIDHIAIYGENLKKIDEVYKSGQNQIALAHPHPSAQVVPLYYNPDVQYFIEKGRKKQFIIFEIADTQSKDKTIVDIIKAYLCPHNVVMMFFIVPNDRKYKLTDATQKIVVHSLSKKIKGKKLPLEVRVVKVPEGISNSKIKVFKILDKEIKPVI